MVSDTDNAQACWIIEGLKLIQFIDQQKVAK